MKIVPLTIGSHGDVARSSAWASLRAAGRSW